jgi:hypothetical protein
MLIWSAFLGSVAQYNRLEEQHVCAIAVVDIIAQQHLTGDDETNWQTHVVNGWYGSRDAGPEIFLLRANLDSADGDEAESVRVRFRERVSSPCGEDGEVEPAGHPPGGAGCAALFLSSRCMEEKARN